MNNEFQDFWLFRAAMEFEPPMILPPPTPALSLILEP